jgi:hypothetical protein
VRLEQLPQAGDVLLEGGSRVLRLVVAPELLDQAITRDDGVPPEQEQGEQAPLFDSAEANLSLTLPDLERAEDAEVEAGSQSATVPRAAGG